MKTFQPARLAILAVIGALALGSAACAYDDYGDHHHRGHDRGGHGPRGGDHGRGHDGHGDHRGGH